jgi:hypothetical protein
VAESKSRGPRVLISWGPVTKKVKGKQVRFTAYSKIPESTQKALGLKVAKTSGTSLGSAAVKKDKRGRLRLSTPGASVGVHYLLAWTGEYTAKGTQKWRRIRLPQEVGLAKAVNILLTGKKIRSIKFPNGVERIINANVAAKKKPATKKKT